MTPRSEKHGRVTKTGISNLILYSINQSFMGWGKLCYSTQKGKEKKKDQGNSKDLLNVQTVTLTSVLAR